MSDIKINIQNDNTDVKESNLSEQASLNTSIHMHAPEDEEKDVCRSILHKEEEYKTRRDELGAIIALDIADKSIKEADVFVKDSEYVVCYDVGRQWPEQGKGQYPKGPYGFEQFVYIEHGEDQAHDSNFYNDSNPDRNLFVRKVFTLLLIALLFTACFVATVLAVAKLKAFFLKYAFFIMIPALVGLLVMNCCVMPFSDCARRYPTNYICLIIVVIIHTLLCSLITSATKTHIVLIALLTTVTVVFVCLMLACTKFDFTKYLLYVIALSITLAAVSMALLVAKFAFGIQMKPLQLAVTIASALVIVVTIIIELQMVLGGKSLELYEDEYVYGAHILYTSIMSDIILMSDINITIENGNKDVKESNLSEQASLNTSVHMHAPEDEEKDVYRSVLCKEEEHKTRRGELGAIIALDIADKSIKEADIFENTNKCTIVCYDFGRQDQGQSQYPLGPYGYGKKNVYYEFDQEGYSDLYGESDSNRNVFVRKVTSIVLIMLLFTVGFVVIVMKVERLKKIFVVYWLYIIIFSFISSIVMSYVIYSSCARNFPCNYICLLIVMLLESVFCSAVTCFYKTHMVLLALLTTAVVVFICVILACTNFDFTKYLLYVIIISLAVFVLSIFVIVAKIIYGLNMKPLEIGIGFAFTLIACVTLIIELQMVLGGKKLELSEEDYAIGAYMLYTSIIAMFLDLAHLMFLFDSDY